jgi:hypothetical protein
VRVAKRGSALIRLQRIYKMINFRAFKESDRQQLIGLTPNGAEPHLESCVVLERDGKITGFAEVRNIVRVEPLGAASAFDVTLLFSYLEGLLNTCPEYEFFVLKENDAFHKYVEKYIPAEPMPLGEGTWYVRKRHQEKP